MFSGPSAVPTVADAVGAAADRLRFSVVNMSAQGVAWPKERSAYVSKGGASADGAATRFSLWERLRKDSPHPARSTHSSSTAWSTPARIDAIATPMTTPHSPRPSGNASHQHNGTITAT